MKKNISKIKKTSSNRKRGHNLNGLNAYQNLLNSHLMKSFKRNISKKDVAVGLLAMGAAGVATMLLLQARKPKKSAYSELKDKAGEYAHEAYDLASNYAEHLKEKASEMWENPTNPLLIVGAIGGTLLGASALYYLTRDHKRSYSPELISKVIEIFNSIKNAATSAGEKDSKGWLGTIKEVMESISDREEDEEEVHHSNSSNLHHALKVGINGLSLLDNMMKKH